MANYYGQFYGDTPGLNGYSPIGYTPNYSLQVANPARVSSSVIDPKALAQALMQMQQQTGYTPAGLGATGAAASSNPFTTLLPWTQSPIFGYSNPLSNVPEEYWQDLLSVMSATAPFAQLDLQRQSMANSQANQAQSNALAWAKMAQDAAAQGDATKLAWAQQGLAEAKAALDAELGRGQLGLSRDQLNAQIMNQQQTNQLARDQFGLSQELGRGSLDVQRQQLAEAIRAAQAGEGLANRQLDSSNNQFEQNFTRQQGLDAFDQAMQRATLDYQRADAASNRDLQRELVAMSTFGRRFAPSVAAM